MNIPSEVNEILIAIILISVAMTLASYLTKHSRNFRSRRNKRARHQDQPFDIDL